MTERVRLWTMPRTVYFSSDRARPRWAFLVRVDNLGEGPLSVERVRVCLNTQSGRIEQPGPDGEARRPQRLTVRPTDQFAVGVMDRGRTPAPPVSVSVDIRLSDEAGSGFDAECRAELLPARTSYLRFPLSGPWFTANARTEHHCLGGQFGFDFIHEKDLPLHDSGEGSELAPQGFASFGQPLLAPADGVVVACEDSQPDLLATPGRASFSSKRPDDPAQLLGNYVIVAISGQRYLVMAHLRKGSLRVRPGECVRAGRQIAEVGNSGSTSGPHCHIELLDCLPDLSALGTAAFNSSGLPFGFVDVFRARGRECRPVQRAIPRQGDVLSPQV